MATTKERAPVVPGALFVLGRDCCESAPRVARGDCDDRRCPTGGTDSAYFAPQSLPIALAAAAKAKSFSLIPPASWVESDSVTRL